MLPIVVYTGFYEHFDNQALGLHRQFETNLIEFAYHNDALYT